MVYHIFASGDWGVEHKIVNNLQEVKEYIKTCESSSDIVGIVKGGKNYDIKT